MAENFRDRAVASLRGRHATKLRELADDIAKEAEYVLADLDRGRVPRLRNLRDAALQVGERIAALEAVDEMAAIYKDAENLDG